MGQGGPAPGPPGVRGEVRRCGVELQVYKLFPKKVYLKHFLRDDVKQSTLCFSQ